MDKNVKELSDGISVITASYKGEKYIRKLLDSMKKQKLSYALFEHIIVINGELDNTNYIIEDFKEKNQDMNISIIYTEITGICNARNIGIKESNKKYSTFIDDDDFISPNYLKELYENASENRIVIAGIADVDENNKKILDSYLTPELSNSGIIKDPYSTLVGMLTLSTCKLIPTIKIKKNKFNENLKSGVDTPFYCNLYSKNNFEFYVIDKKKKATYYRLKRNNSLSRRPLSYEFNVEQRLGVIKNLNEIMNNSDVLTKEFIKKKINAQTIFINRYLSKNLQHLEKILNDIKKLKLDYFPYSQMNKGLAKKLIISFNFPPYVSTSGNNTAKRINNKGEIVDIVYNMMGRKIDKKLNLIADKFIDKKILIKSPTTFGGWNGIKKFVDSGMKLIDKMVQQKGEYKEIYSRSMFPASHFLAFEYKIKYPEVKWVAEFSDPLLYDIKGNIRDSKVKSEEFIDKINKLLVKKGLPKCEDNNLFLLCEYLPYVFADEIVFTNKNQKEYMINKFPIEGISNIINEKSLIKVHSTLSKAHYEVIESNYPLKQEIVNLAYFGSFYETRNLEDVFIALYGLDKEIREKCLIHFFTSNAESFRDHVDCYPVKNNIKVNDYVSFFEFLNLTTKFDCLIVNDANTKDYKSINPYLPSKLSDYLGSGSNIWIIFEEGSVMSEFNVKYKSKLGDTNNARTTLKKIIDDQRVK